MMDARKIYPGFAKDCDGGKSYPHAEREYDPIIESLGRVIARADDDEYQGDTFALVERDGRVGYVNFGWGSCSGCDELQACKTIDELQALCDRIESQTRWFDTAADALEFVNEHDWEGEYSWHGDAIHKFLPAAKSALAELVG